MSVSPDESFLDICSAFVTQSPSASLVFSSSAQSHHYKQFLAQRHGAVASHSCISVDMLVDMCARQGFVGYQWLDATQRSLVAHKICTQKECRARIAYELQIKEEELDVSIQYSSLLLKESFLKMLKLYMTGTHRTFTERRKTQDESHSSSHHANNKTSSKTSNKASVYAYIVSQYVHTLLSQHRVDRIVYMCTLLEGRDIFDIHTEPPHVTNSITKTEEEQERSICACFLELAPFETQALYRVLIDAGVVHESRAISARSLFSPVSRTPSTSRLTIATFDFVRQELHDTCRRILDLVLQGIDTQSIGIVVADDSIRYKDELYLLLREHGVPLDYVPEDRRYKKTAVTFLIEFFDLLHYGVRLDALFSCLVRYQEFLKIDRAVLQGLFYLSRQHHRYLASYLKSHWGLSEAQKVFIARLYDITQSLVKVRTLYSLLECVYTLFDVLFDSPEYPLKKTLNKSPEKIRILAKKITEKITDQSTREFFAPLRKQLCTMHLFLHDGIVGMPIDKSFKPIEFFLFILSEQGRSGAQGGNAENRGVRIGTFSEMLVNEFDHVFFVNMSQESLYTWDYDPLMMVLENEPKTMVHFHERIRNERIDVLQLLGITYPHKVRVSCARQGFESQHILPSLFVHSEEPHQTAISIGTKQVRYGLSMDTIRKGYYEHQPKRKQSKTSSIKADQPLTFALHPIWGQGLRHMKHSLGGSEKNFLTQGLGETTSQLLYAQCIRPTAVDGVSIDDMTVDDVSTKASHPPYLSAGSTARLVQSPVSYLFDVLCQVNADTLPVSSIDVELHARFELGKRLHHIYQRLIDEVVHRVPSDTQKHKDVMHMQEKIVMPTEQALSESVSRIVNEECEHVYALPYFFPCVRAWLKVKLLEYDIHSTFRKVLAHPRIHMHSLVSREMTTNTVYRSQQDSSLVISMKGRSDLATYNSYSHEYFVLDYKSSVQDESLVMYLYQVWAYLFLLGFDTTRPTWYEHASLLSFKDNKFYPQELSPEKYAHIVERLPLFTQAFNRSLYILKMGHYHNHSQREDIQAIFGTESHSSELQSDIQSNIQLHDESYIRVLRNNFRLYKGYR